MGYVNIPRRNILNLLGIGGALIAGAPVTLSPALADAPHGKGKSGRNFDILTARNSDVRTPMKSQVITDQPGIVIADKMIIGGSGLKLVRCPGAVIENLDISQSSFSGLWLHDCPAVQVHGCVFHSNGSARKNWPTGSIPIGHGIYWSGNSSGFVTDTLCHQNIEDGAQHSKSMTGLVTYTDVVFRWNKENAFDGKGGRAKFVRGVFESTKPRVNHTPPQPGDDPTWLEGLGELFLVQRNFVGLEVEDALLRTTVNKAFIYRVQGTAMLRNCRFDPTDALPDDRWFRSNGFINKSSLPSFSKSGLTVTGGVESAQLRPILGQSYRESG